MTPRRFLAMIGALCGTAVYVTGTVLYAAVSRLLERQPDAEAEALWAHAEAVNARRS